MFKDSRSIVVRPAQVALYNSGIPSLLYCALSLPVATMTPFGRVAMQLSVNPIPEAAEGIALHHHFVINEVLFRWRKHAVVHLLDRFSSVDEMP